MSMSTFIEQLMFQNSRTLLSVLWTKISNFKDKRYCTFSRTKEKQRKENCFKTEHFKISYSFMVIFSFLHNLLNLEKKRFLIVSSNKVKNKKKVTIRNKFYEGSAKNSIFIQLIILKSRQHFVG